MWIQGKSDVKDELMKHIAEIDKELFQTGFGEGKVRATLLATKTEALKALLEVYK